MKWRINEEPIRQWPLTDDEVARSISGRAIATRPHLKIYADDEAIESLRVSRSKILGCDNPIMPEMSCGHYIVKIQ